MNKQEFVKAIEELVALDEEFNQHNDRLKQLFGNDSSAENVFLDMHYRARGVTIKHLSMLVEDSSDGWIEWYLDNGLQLPLVSIGDVEYPCFTAKDLFGIIKVYNKAGQK